MWWKTMVMILTIAVLSIDTAQASVTWDIWEDTTITTGTYDNIRIDYENPNPGSIVSMCGGKALTVIGYKTSTFTLSGNAEIDGFYTGTGSSSFYLLEDGIVGNVGVSGYAQAHLHGGTIESHVSASENAEIHIYGYNFNLTSDILTGCWESGDPFSIWLRGPDTLSRTYLHIPEPATLLFVSLGGGLLLRRRFPSKIRSL